MGKKNPVKSNPGVLNMGQIQPGFERVEPLISVDKLKRQFLFGIPLVSQLTGEEMTDDTIKEIIAQAVSDFETATRVPVSPVRIKDRFDFRRPDDLAFSTRQLTRWPVIEVEALHALFPGRMDGRTMPNIDPVNDPENQAASQEIEYPSSWIEIEGDSGLMRIIPKSGSLVNADISFIATTGYRSILLGGLKEWPSLWRVTYRAGFDQDKIPGVVNKLIGTFAAIQVISNCYPALSPANSFGIGLDGMSQSIGIQLAQLLMARINDLVQDRDRLINQIKMYYGTDMQFSIF